MKKRMKRSMDMTNTGHSIRSYPRSVMVVTLLKFFDLTRGSSRFVHGRAEPKSCRRMGPPHAPVQVGESGGRDAIVAVDVFMKVGTALDAAGDLRDDEAGLLRR
jgi:hypothetical protein